MSVSQLPEGLEPEKAGPLMCAGCTVWEPILNHCGPGRRVGVVSIGGLGHMAIKLLSKTGATITAISRGADKKSKALEFGAHNYVDRTDADAMKNAACSLDVIIDTNPCSMGANGEAENISPLMDLLVFGGTFVKVGVPPSGFQYHFVPLVFSGRKIEVCCCCFVCLLGSSHHIVCRVPLCRARPTRSSCSKRVLGTTLPRMWRSSRSSK